MTSLEALNNQIEATRKLLQRLEGEVNHYSVENLALDEVTSELAKASFKTSRIMTRAIRNAGYSYRRESSPKPKSPAKPPSTDTKPTEPQQQPKSAS